MVRKRAQQGTLPGYKPTALETAVKHLLDLKADLEVAKENFNKAADTVKEEMIKVEKKFLLVDHFEFTIKLTEAKEKLVIKESY